MKKTILFLFIACTTAISAQNTLHWDGQYQLQISDFQSEDTDIGLVRLVANTGIGFAFAFHLAPGESDQARNFNYRVTNSFSRKDAALLASDHTWAEYLTDFARFEWDLSELYARKFRKQLQEAKKPTADYNFVSPIYEELKAQYSIRLENARLEVDLGQMTEKLVGLRQQVKAEIDALPEYCRSCPPVKAKK